MCDHYFPNHQYSFGDKALNDTRFEDILCSYERPFYKIHWFEFCMTFLLNVLVSGNLLENYNAEGKFLITHLVDYLYDIFEKQKNENTNRNL